MPRMSRRRTQKMEKRVRDVKSKDDKIKILRGLLFIFAAVILILLILLVLLLIKSPKYTQIFDAYALPLSGYDKVDISISAPNTVLLTSGCLQLDATTTSEQIESILMALENSENVRPNAHEIVKFVFDEYAIMVIAVKIEAVQESSYFSKLVVQQGNKVLELDARPSDAIAIALRADAPVYIKKDLLANFGSNIC